MARVIVPSGNARIDGDGRIGDEVSLGPGAGLVDLSWFLVENSSGFISSQEVSFELQGSVSDFSGCSRFLHDVRRC